MSAHHRHKHFKADLSDFFVVLVYSNTARMKRRTDLFNIVADKVEKSGVDHVLVELAFGDREFQVTNSVQLNHLRLRTIEEFWHKENLINLGIHHGMRLWPGKKKHVMWLDGDCEPIGMSMHEWFCETWQELQHHKFVQCWQWLQHLDYDLQPLGHDKGGSGLSPSFMFNYTKYGHPYPDQKNDGYPKQWGSPGLCWAAEIQALLDIGMIGDVSITGGGDWYLAHMLISDLPFADFKKGGYTPEYVQYWKHRQELCERWIKRDVGFVKAFMSHFFHGKLQNRGYNWREQILIKGHFNQNTDLKKDHQGLWQLETYLPRQIWMRDQLRRYARSRNEDSIDS